MELAHMSNGEATQQCRFKPSTFRSTPESREGALLVCCRASPPDRRVQSSSKMIEQPPTSRIAHSRESFPGRLTIPTQMDIPSLSVISPSHSYTKLHPDYSTPSRYHSRHFSTSSFISQYSQRTQSTVQAIPTSPFAYAHHRRRRGSFASSTGRGSRAATPIQFFKRSARKGSAGDVNVIEDPDAFQELESQTTDFGGFQYAATPSVREFLKADRTPQNLRIPVPVPALRPRLPPSPLSNSGKGRKIQARIWEGVKVLENITRKLRKLKGKRASCCPLTISVRVKPRRGQQAKSDIERMQRGKGKAVIPRGVSQSGKIREVEEFWKDHGERTLRIKNNGNGPCVFIVTMNPDNPQAPIETPLSLAYLKSQLFVHSKALVKSLDDWNKHFQNPPQHWVINFVPKAYLRRGWHLSEEVVKYLRTYGLNVGTEVGGVHHCPWRVEYEAIGQKACLVGEGGTIYWDNQWDRSHTTEGNSLMVPWDSSRVRHPSRCWEREEGWDGCKELVVGIAL
ncbi:hypothetical protein BDZ91DRAFT_844478 [Kalaharituber pfeilii]|nr:hypothetical protein BDZ91DRAFT_844478 [Kalaharituber pfeilii]